MMMKSYRQSIASGVKPTDSQWQNLLKDWHNRDPGMTQRLLTRYRTNEDKSSYATLVEAAGDLRGKHCLDLACGDGALLAELLPKIGDNGLVTAVDMSKAELNRAKQAYPDHRVTFYETMAQTLPLSTASVDFVFCHLALMLIMPIDPALDEIARVLKPSGELCAVIIAPLEHKEPTKSIFAWIRNQVAQKLHRVDLFNMGDPRFTSEDGIKTLFSAHPEFMPIENFKLFYLQLEYQAESLWADLSSFYLPRLLNCEEIREIGNEAAKMLRKHIGNQKRITLPFACRYFCANRR